MLIATFNSASGWGGKTIVWDPEGRGRFVLTGAGPMSAMEVMRHDREGHLLWASDAMREWAKTVEAGHEWQGTDKSRTTHQVTRREAVPTRSVKPEKKPVVLKKWEAAGILLFWPNPITASVFGYTIVRDLRRRKGTSRT